MFITGLYMNRLLLFSIFELKAEIVLLFHLSSFRKKKYMKILSDKK
jgi:hypothetical protein